MRGLWWKLTAVAILFGTVLSLLVERGHGPLADFFCPPEVTGYAQEPRPDAPLALVNSSFHVGDTFAVRTRTTRPPDTPTVTGAPASVHWTDTATFPVQQRCGELYEGYRYFLFLATAPGDPTVEHIPVHISA